MGAATQKADLRIGDHQRPRAVILAVLALAGCASVGPKTIPRDRLEYVEALRDSWKRQVLLNIVALRYDEAPSFLEVVSVINQYSLEGRADAGLRVGSLTDDTTIGVGGNWSDRPTITYSPLTGERYVRSMLTPIPPASVVALVNSGWPADFVLDLTVRSINGVAATGRSRFMGQIRSRGEFPAVLSVLRRIQLAGGMGMHVEDDGSVILSFRAPADESEAEDLRALGAELGLELGRTEFRVVYGSEPAGPEEVVILTRSIIDIMNELSTWVDVPPDDVAAGIVPAYPDVSPGDESENPAEVLVRWSDADPAGAFAKVRYRGRWFFVGDADRRSKRTLSFMLVLLSLTESGGGQSAPLVTVGAGG